MNKSSSVWTIIIAALMISIVFPATVKAEISTNVSGGASAVVNGTNDEDQSNVSAEIPAGGISNGVYADTVNLSSKTYDEACAAIADYIESLKAMEITLISINGESRIVTAGELGLSWTNQEIVAEAVRLGKEGNIVARYKALKDLEYENVVYPVVLGFDHETTKKVIEAQAEQDNIVPIDATISREEEQFNVIPGQTGFSINIDASVRSIEETLNNNWNKAPITIELAIDVNEPKGKTDELEMVKDVLGTYTTSYKTSGTSRAGNVANGTRLISGKVLFPGEEFSVYEAVEPFTEDNGYYMAGSYLNGLVVESLGGGICQVSSTLYNAAIRAELDIKERYNHSMIVSYVNLSSDAAISGTSKDFRFVNNYEYPIFIEGITSEDRKITFTIYGVEVRPDNREVSYESVEISKTVPEGERVIADAGQPVGYIDVQSAHTGYVGELWKVVKVDGIETERVKVNESTYAAAPRTATVGTAAANPEIAATMAAAIATNNIDYCKGIIAQLNAAAAMINADIPVE